MPFEYDDGDETDEFDNVDGPVGVEGGSMPVKDEVRPTEDPEPGLDP